MTAMKRRTKIRRRRRGEGWQRYRVLYICIIASVLLHLCFIVSISPWWLGRAAKIKPRAVKVVSLKIKPRLARPRPPVKAPPKPEVKPVERAPVPKPVYTEKELERKLDRVRSKVVPEKFAKPKADQVREVVKRKEKAARAWVEREVDTFEERVEREAAGEVGYSRVIDLKRSSDYQVGRVMEHYKISIGYGSRKITDLNIRFSSEWVFTPGQLRNYVNRHNRSDSREIMAAVPSGEPAAALRESGEGSPRPYIEPTVDAMAAILIAEEEYFAETGSDPDKMERLVFGPVWTYRGPAFKVVKAEKKEGSEKRLKTKDNRP